MITRVRSITVGLNKYSFTNEQTTYEKLFDENYILDKNKCIPEERGKLQKQLDHLNSKGETEKAAKAEAKLDRLNKIDDKLEKSLVSSKEAEFATKHLKMYSVNQSGLQGAKGSAELTFIISSAENIYKYSKGEIGGVEAIDTVFKETVIGGGTGYCLNFISELTGSSAIVMGLSSYSDIKFFQMAILMIAN